jgi:hypothetical protein
MREHIGDLHGRELFDLGQHEDLALLVVEAGQQAVENPHGVGALHRLGRSAAASIVGPGATALIFW